MKPIHFRLILKKIAFFFLLKKDQVEDLTEQALIQHLLYFHHLFWFMTMAGMILESTVISYHTFMTLQEAVTA
jgi:uncharacterized phage-associated protein